MILDEVIIKLSSFFLIGFIFGLSQFFFLSYTENIIQRKGVYNISAYFPLSYGIITPLIGILLPGTYYPIGMVKYPHSKFQFEVDHSSARFFAYFTLIIVFILTLVGSNYLFDHYHIQFYTKDIIDWFLQVFLVFLIFNLFPVFPTVFGGFLLKELKQWVIRKRKLGYLPLFNALTQMSLLIFFIGILSLNYNVLDYKVKNLLNILNQMLLKPPVLIFSLLFFLTLMIYLIYTKKKEYQEYIKYIKQALSESFLNEQKIKQQDKTQK